MGILTILPSPSLPEKCRFIKPYFKRLVWRSAELNNSMRIAREEIFGLAAAVWTRDISRAHTIARKLKAGTVWVNCYGMLDPISPFGGYKQSGFGRELGKYAIELYTEINLSS